MKKSVIRILMAVTLVFSASILQPVTASAKVNIPDKVRIGIYYENSAQSRISVSAQKGLQFGSSLNGAFNVLYDDPSNNVYSVLKDSAAAYHILLYNSLPDYNSANIKVQAAKQAGIDAYPVFSDTWQVWTGYYPDAATANTAIAAVQQKLGAGSYSVVNPSSLRIAIQNSSGGTVLMFNSANSVLQIYPRAENIPNVFSLNSSRYRGGLEVRRLTSSDMTIINVIPLEEYLYGVVPNEIQASSNIEALKAQAVAARTYVIRNLNRHGAYKFDVCPTTHCQMYVGYNTEYPSTNKAVDDTKSLIVTYNGQVAETLYCASSGGPTEDSTNVWGGTTVPYLVSVDNKYELTTSSHYYWQESFTPSQIKTIMFKYGYDLGDITGISVIERTQAGRVNKLLIQGTKDSKTLTKENTKDMLGLDSRMYDITSGTAATTGSLSVSNGSSSSTLTLNGKTVVTSSGLKQISANSSITVLGSGGTSKIGGGSTTATTAKFVFTGKGWGHAVGMSQEGARGMALAGFKFDEILTHYYPGTKIE